MKKDNLPLSSAFIPVLKTRYALEDYIRLDLSVNNPDLLSYNLSSATSIQQYIQTIYNSTGKKIAYGGYLEQRAIYKRSTHFSKNNPELERNIHLGVDFWAPENTPVIAPVDGIVHSFKNNEGLGDYGPTIILEHQLNGKKLYTLYGHLSLASIHKIEVGQTIKKGQVFAFLGAEKVNGNYAPHLHFQILFDMQKKVGDYPGVCSRKDLLEYKKNGMDPILFLNM